MLAYEIIGSVAGVAVGEAVATGVEQGLPDGWKSRATATRRNEERRQKLVGKVRDLEAKAHDQKRTAQDRQFRANDKIRALQRDLATKPDA